MNNNVKKVIFSKNYGGYLSPIYFTYYLFFPTAPTFKESLTYIEKEEMPIFLVDSLEYVARTSIVKESEGTDELILEIIESLTINSEKLIILEMVLRSITRRN